MAFIWNLILLIVIFSLINRSYQQYESYEDIIQDDEISYYENLVNQNIAEAFAAQIPQTAQQHAPVNPGILDFGIYDYIVVGSGSAGATAASRLSEVAKWKVLLLEAGEGESEFSDVPYLYVYLQGLRFNWNYTTIPQTTCCLGNINRACAYARGKVLGGSSTINPLVYSRGHREDYDLWASQGNPGWSYEDVLPVFMMSENSRINGDPGYHGEGGYWNVEYPQGAYGPILDGFLGANQEMGYKTVDYNGEQEIGAAPCQFSIINGRRHSTAKAFLGPALHRPNLEILISSYVTKIIIDPAKKQAEGVIFSKNGQLYSVKAKKDVIISAGSISSPAILMRSGIGPAQHLEELGISVVEDLPVGQRLYDHSNFVGAYFQLNYTLPNLGMREYIREYLQGSGPLTIAQNSQAIGFYRVDQTIGRPDFELLVIPPNSTTPYTVRSFNFDNDIANIVNSIDPTSTVSIYVIGLHPKSYGSIQLASKNPYDYPMINANYLSDSEGHDIEVLYQGLQFLMQLGNTAAFQKFGATMIPANLPACKYFEYLSRDYWYCVIRQFTNNLYHPMGTCRMGPDPYDSVVDNHLRVHGIKGLRVADASIYPVTISGHIGAPTVMVGDKLALIIKGEEGV